MRSLDHPGRLSASVAEHRRVFQLVIQKDAVGAEWAMRDHVTSSAREVLADPRGLPGGE